MKKLTKRQVKLITWLLTIVIVSVTLTTVFILNSRGVEDFSEEQHIARISKRIQKNYINDETGYTDFKVYPLYNENEEVIFYMVEFQPKGFVYIEAENVNGFFWQIIFGGTRYWLSDLVPFNYCSYHNINEETHKAETYYHNGDCGGYGENGWNERCAISPFVLANMQNERRYILRLGNDNFSKYYYVLAIKQGGEYLNIITNETFTFNDGQFSPQQTVCAFISFHSDIVFVLK